MKHPIHRRTVLLALGSSAFVAASTMVAEGSTDLRGMVSFEGGEIIPKGELQIFIEDPSVTEDKQSLEASAVFESDGGSRAIEFSVSLPIRSAIVVETQIVALLTRADGWLLARGSAGITSDKATDIILYKAMY